MVLKIVLYSGLICLSITDLFHHKIPDVILFSVFLISFVLLISTDYFSISIRTMISLFFFTIFYIIANYSKGLGFGDVKLIFVTSFCTGFFPTIVAVLYACIFGIAYIMLFQKEKSKIAFCPFISLGYLISEFVGVLTI